MARQRRGLPCLEACPVLADLGALLCDPYPGCFCSGVNRGVHESRRLLGELVEHVGLFEVDVLGVADTVRKRVLGGEPAQVIGLAVVLLAAHPPSAQAAEHDATPCIVVRPAVRLCWVLLPRPG